MADYLTAKKRLSVQTVYLQVLGLQCMLVSYSVER